MTNKVKELEESSTEEQLDLVDWIEEQEDTSNKDLINRINKDGNIGMEDY